MAEIFIWTYASWDKIRPKLLPSTGLGEVLKVYDKARDQLEKLDIDELLVGHRAALTALEKVDQTRELAIKKCGIPFKTCKKALEAGDVERERTALSNILGLSLTKYFNEVKKPLADEFIKLNGKIDRAAALIKKLELALRNANAEAKVKAEQTGVKLDPAFLKKFFGEYVIKMDPAELRLASSVANGENNFSKNQSYPDVIKNVEFKLKAKWAHFEKIAPKPVISKGGEIIKALGQFQQLNMDYGQQLGQIKRLYGPFSID